MRHSSVITAPDHGELETVLEYVKMEFKRDATEHADQPSNYL